MSKRGGSSSSSNGKGNGVVVTIPAASKKMVQSLKEIVNCPENEIYAMLNECNLDPNETVNRLLSQDTFHEVKSKRGKKKEMKENTESRSRDVNGTSNRGRGGSDHDVWHSRSPQFSSSEYVIGHGKHAYKKDNGTNAVPNSSSTSGITANNVDCRSTSLSNAISKENTVKTMGTSDGISSSSEPASGFQPAWLRARRHVTMADIVKMGRPRAKISTIQTSEIASSHSPVNQDILNGDWPLIEQSPAVSGPSVGEAAGASINFADCSSSSLHVDRVNLHPSSESDEVLTTEQTMNVQNQIVDSIRSVAASDGQTQLDSSESTSYFDDTSLKSGSYQCQSPTPDHQEGNGGSSHLYMSDCLQPSLVEDVSEAATTAAARLQNLSLQEEEISAPPGEENPAVIIPNHLQVPTADCSHLSFGSFGSGIGATFYGSFVSKTLKSNLSEASTAADGSSVENLDSRNPDCYGNEQQRYTSNENAEFPLSSLAEVAKHDNAEEARHGHRHQCPFPSSAPDYAIENTVQADAGGYSYSQTNSQMQNLASYSSEMAIKMGAFTTPQPTTPETLPNTSIPPVPALPEHLPTHPYSQPTLFANMTTYPFLPQSYSYMPSAFQQAYAANNVYHQSPAAVQGTGIKYSLPQYKNSISLSSLSHPATIASGYGGFGSSTNIPGSFLLNPSTTPPSTAISFEEAIGSQYRDSNHYGTQQNEASTMWVNAHGSRTMSALPASTYYGYPGQNQHGAIQQSQQPSHYGASDYPNFYHSQAGVSQEHQPPSDGTLKASQGPSQQSHQIWQHSY
ncbi:hypothetical protein AAC387_Pa12g2268 [Persea americana]